ncbi:MAG: outer membrane protein assembly factor BamB [Cellvibrionaceae bacterium]|nr:outer membrane protein assembly factor BamB [Cellvibrionaceae bacterium]
MPFLLVLLLGFLGACATDAPLPNELTALDDKITIRQHWQQQVGVGTGPVYRLMSPVLDGNRLYASDKDGQVYAFDKTRGDVQWRQPLNLDLAAGVSVAADLVLLASLEGEVVALDKQTGEVRWQVNLTGEILAPPQSNGEVVVVQTNDGRLLGLSARSGETLWTYSTNLPLLTLRGTATPVLFGNNLITGFANGRLAAFAAADGTLYWERRIARPQGRTDIERVVDIDGSPVLAGKLIYTTSYNGNLSAIASNGDILWSQPASSSVSPVVINGRVIVSTTEGWLRAYDARDGLLLWENTLLSRRQLSAPQNLAGFTVVADYQGYVHVVDTETGVILGRFQVDSAGVRSPMVSAGHHLYVLGNDGVLSSLSVHLIAPQDRISQQ